jgi:hypothetical protein
VEAGVSVESLQPNQMSAYLAYIPILYIFSKLSVLYPATALDQPMTAKWAWQLTDHNGWRLTIIVGLLPWILYFIVKLLFRENSTFVEHIIFRLMGFALLAVEIVTLSYAYKYLTEQVTHPASEH